MTKNQAIKTAANIAVAAAMCFTPMMANAQFGNLLKDLKAIEDSLKGSPRSAETVQQSGMQSPQEDAPRNPQRSDDAAQAAISQKSADGLRPGYYRKGNDSTLHVISSSRDIKFSLSIGHGKQELECDHMDAYCLKIDGVMKENGTGAVHFRDQDVTCYLKSFFKNDSIFMTYVDGSCGAGSINRHQLKLIDGEYKLSANARNIAASNMSSTGVTRNQFGYLAGRIKTYEGAGCSYYRKEDEKKKEPRTFAADDYSGKGIVLNMDGKDVLLKEKSRNSGKNHEVSSILYEDHAMRLTVRFGASRSCGEECSKTMSTFEISTGDQKISIPTYAICGS